MQLFHRSTGQGTPLVILHGLFGSSDNWLSIAKLLEDSYHVYLLDQRNHGQSPHSDLFDYEAMAADLLAFFETHKLAAPLVMGHSMGGKTVMEFALRYPDRLEKLVVVDIAPRPYPPHHQQILAGLNAIPVAQLKTRSEADAILGEYVSELGIRQFLLKNLYREPKSGEFRWRINLPVLTEQIENVGAEIHSLHAFGKPTLFLHGGNSEYIRPQDVPEIKALFPRATLTALPGTGHWLHAEKPEEFVAVLRRFLEA